LPNFGNVNLNNIFSINDSKLKNRDSVKIIIDNYYKSVWEKNNLWGGFLVAKGNDIIYEAYRGFAQDLSKNPILENTPLHIASVSKTLTAMAVMKLIETGKIKMNDAVTKFFPDFPYPNVTIFTLLSQRSGLPKYEYFFDEKSKLEKIEFSKEFLTNRDILDMLIRYKPQLLREPNTGFIYCNTNFAILALIIEKITKTDFPEAMNLMIFQPLKMKNTYILTEKKMGSAAKSFYPKNNRVYPYNRLDLIYGDKNVYSTPRDLFNFSRAMFAKNFLREDLQKMIFQPYSNEKQGMNNYGIGFRMKIFNENEKLTYHNGWWHGTNSVFAHLLNSKVTIIAIGNKYSRRVYSALSLSGIFENLPYETEKFNEIINETDSLNSNDLQLQHSNATL
jgi:CubicO group peptidase (beta-lactamase class C family)